MTDNSTDAAFLQSLGRGGQANPFIKPSVNAAGYIILSDFYFSSAGAGNIFTLSVSGGFTLSGALTLIRQRVQAVSGGIIFSGVASFVRSRILSVSGALALFGSAALIRNRAVVSTGEVNFNGSAAMTFVPSSGGGGGTAANQRTLVGTGI